MDRHEFHLLLCKYFSTVTVLFYLPHLLYVYILLFGKGLFGGREMRNAIFYLFISFSLFL